LSPELIGILGWQGIWLPTWTYVVLTVLLVVVLLEKLKLEGAARARVILMTGLTVLFSPTHWSMLFHVRGVQGGYFVIVLPVAAVFVAAIVDRDLPKTMPAAIAMAGSIIAGTATVEALFRAHW
jgi:hypothetical protein